jgi:hypothetical protein
LGKRYSPSPASRSFLLSIPVAPTSHFYRAIDNRTLSARVDIWNAAKVDKCLKSAQAALLLERASGRNDSFGGQL